MRDWSEPNFNPFEVLGVSPDDDRGTVKRAYHRLIRIHKPETDPTGFQKVRAAYEWIINQIDAEAGFDESLFSGASAVIPSPAGLDKKSAPEQMVAEFFRHHSEGNPGEALRHLSLLFANEEVAAYVLDMTPANQSHFFQLFPARPWKELRPLHSPGVKLFRRFLIEKMDSGDNSCLLDCLEDPTLFSDAERNPEVDFLLRKIILCAGLIYPAAARSPYSTLEHTGYDILETFFLREASAASWRKISRVCPRSLRRYIEIFPLLTNEEKESRLAELGRGARRGPLKIFFLLSFFLNENLFLMLEYDLRNTWWNFLSTDSEAQSEQNASRVERFVLYANLFLTILPYGVPIAFVGTMGFSDGPLVMYILAIYSFMLVAVLRRIFSGFMTRVRISLVRLLLFGKILANPVDPLLLADSLEKKNKFPVTSTGELARVIRQDHILSIAYYLGAAFQYEAPRDSNSP